MGGAAAANVPQRRRQGHPCQAPQPCRWADLGSTHPAQEFHCCHCQADHCCHSAQGSVAMAVAMVTGALAAERAVVTGASAAEAAGAGTCAGAAELEEAVDGIAGA